MTSISLCFEDEQEPPFNSGVAVRGPAPFWKDFDDTESANEDVLMVQFFPDAVYGVVMVDRDANKDIGEGELATIKTQCDLAWKAEIFAQQQAGNSPTSAATKAAGFEAVKTALFAYVHLFAEVVGDDIITPDNTNGVQRLTSPQDKPRL